MATTIQKVNNLLRKNERFKRLIRDAKGYYYVSDVAVSSMLCVYKLEDKDFELAVDHVEEVISADQGKLFKLNRE
jgi:hypothetical protein